MLHAVVMAGGTGTRFWPQSRRAMPKQLLALTGSQTMIQLTVERPGDLIEPERAWVVTNRVQATETARQLPRVPEANVLIEPCGRNTAPCIGLAAIHLLKRDPAARMLVMPADHAIPSVAEFQADVRLAVAQIEREPDSLVLFGVRPSYPSIGFGYIERGDRLSGESPVFAVAAFREKPQLEVAEQYFGSGRHYWNCGIFVWSAETVLECLARFEPDISQRLNRLSEMIGTPDWEVALEDEFPRMNSISIDYAVLERAELVRVIEASFVWDDLGSWNALARLLGEDSARNTLVGATCAVDARECIVRTSDDHLVAVSGVENLIIVHTPDATMVADRQDENAVRRLVAQLESSGYADYL